MNPLNSPQRALDPLSPHRTAHEMGFLLAWGSSQNLSGALAKGLFTDGEAERDLMMGGDQPGHQEQNQSIEVGQKAEAEGLAGGSESRLYQRWGLYCQQMARGWLKIPHHQLIRRRPRAFYHNYTSYD
jgi:hypothetical protein